MFSITDEDRSLREEVQLWRRKLKNNLTQEVDRYIYVEGENRAETILANSLGAILQERTAALRLQYREDQFPQRAPYVHVIVSQKAIEEAMAHTRMRVMSDENVRKLIYRFISEDFAVNNLRVDSEDGEYQGFTVSGVRYSMFTLSIPHVD